MIACSPSFPVLKLADAFDANGPKLNGGANVDAAGALCTAVWKSTGMILRYLFLECGTREGTLD